MFERWLRKFQKQDFDVDQENVSIYSYHVMMKVMFLLHGVVDGRGKRPWYLSFNLIVIFTCGALGLFALWCCLQHDMRTGDLAEGTEVFTYLIVVLFQTAAVVGFHFDCELYRDLRDELEGSFQFISSPEGRKYRKSFYEAHLLTWQVSLLWTVMISGMLSVFILKFNLDLVLYYVVEQDAGATRPLLIPMRLPEGIDRGETPYYEILFILQNFVMLTFTEAFLPFHYLTMLSVGHLVAQLGMTINDLEGLTIDLPDTLAQNAMRETLKARIKVAVDRHNRAYKYFHNMTTIYRKWYSFMQLSTTPTVCLTAYNIANDLDEHKMNFLMLILCSGGAAQYLVPCLGITIINTQFSAVGGACGGCAWWAAGGAGRGAARDLCLVLARAQRDQPARLPGFRPLSLEEYLRVMTAAYSYFNMLRQLKS